MKKIGCLVALGVFLFSGVARAENFEAAIGKEIEACSINYDKYAEGDESPTSYTLMMIDLEKKRSDCYLSVGNQIIDECYSSIKEKMKAQWKGYVQSVVALNFEIESGKENCDGNCGLSSQMNAIYDSNSELKTKLQSMLK